MLQNQQNRNQLRVIRESMSFTNFGQQWPQSYKDFYALWGYFNSIYNFYTHRDEWARIALFSLDPDFQAAAAAVLALPATHLLAEQPCVGDGRRAFAPSERIRTATLTLRAHFGIDTQPICANSRQMYISPEQPLQHMP